MILKRGTGVPYCQRAPMNIPGDMRGSAVSGSMAFRRRSSLALHPHQGLSLVEGRVLSSLIELQQH